MTDKEYGRIRKNPSTEIVVKVTEYKGSVGLDIREWIESDRYTGFSKSGVRIPADQVCQLEKLIAAACEDLAKE